MRPAFFIPMRDLKLNIKTHLDRADLRAVVTLAREERQVLSQLVRLAYDKETLVGRRAIEAIGMIARDRSDADHPVFRELIRKLLWSLSDESGGIGWSAPEILGEIVSADTEHFHDIVPLIAQVFTIEERVFRAGVLYALWRIAQADPGASQAYLHLAIQGLYDPEPLVRVYGLMMLDALKGVLTPDQERAVRVHKDKLADDNAEVWLYESGAFQNHTVGEIAQK
jgi:hypothetical protein